MTDTAIRMAIISRNSWIKKQQSDFAKQPRQHFSRSQLPAPVNKLMVNQ
jgi:predicted metal-dependent hydrolase